MNINYVVEPLLDGTLRVRTDGLVYRGRPELEAIEVERGQLESTKQLLAVVASSVAERPVVTGRELRLPNGRVVELHEGTHIQAGRFARGVGQVERTVFRVVEVGRASNRESGRAPVCESTTSMSVPGT